MKASWGLVLGALALLGEPVDAVALSLTHRDDNALVALDSRTGERRWTHFPERLSQAVCELHPQLLVAHGTAWGDGRLEFVETLDPETGAVQSVDPPTTPPLAASGTFAAPEVRLANGWRLDPNFSPGNDQQLRFLDDQDQVVWTLDTSTYPHEVAAWNDTVLWAVGYLADEGTVYAHRAGEDAPSWTFDPNGFVTSTPPLTRPYFRVFGDELFVGAHEHVFAIDPSSGALRQQWDLASLTGVPFEADWTEPAFFGGGLNLGTFSLDAETLVVGFERRVVAIDRASSEVLWHADPGSFPYDPYPLVRGGSLVMTAGGGFAGPRPVAEQPALAPSALYPRGGCSVAPPCSGSIFSCEVLGVALLAFACRRRRQ